MTTRFAVAAMLAVLALGQPAARAEQVAAPAAPVGTQTVSGKVISPEQMRLAGRETELNRVSTELFRVLHVVREERDRKLKQDGELKAIVEEIARLQNQIDRRLTEKYPDLGKLTAEQKRLQAEYEKIAAEVQKLRAEQEAGKAAAKP